MKIEDIWKNQEIPVGSKRGADKKLLLSLEHHHDVVKSRINRLILKYMNLGVMFNIDTVGSRQDIFGRKFNDSSSNADLFYFKDNETGRALADTLAKLFSTRKNLRFRISNLRERYLRDRLDKKSSGPYENR